MNVLTNKTFKSETGGKTPVLVDFMLTGVVHVRCLVRFLTTYRRTRISTAN